MADEMGLLAPYKHCVFIIMLSLKLGKFLINARTGLAMYTKKAILKKDTE